ncbi:hypothetical protein EMIT07CA2_40112 [Brevibacillus sp. IT-7CA2]
MESSGLFFLLLVRASLPLIGRFTVVPSLLSYVIVGKTTGRLQNKKTTLSGGGFHDP